MKKAFLTGITGQDGSYLAELLLDKGYEVHAILRRASVFTTQRVEHILEHESLFKTNMDFTPILVPSWVHLGYDLKAGEVLDCFLGWIVSCKNHQKVTHTASNLHYQS